MHDRGLSYGTPRWVKLAAVAVIALLLLFGGLHLLGHSPGGLHHHVPPSGATEHDRQRP
jgi:hypothetical protein